MAKKSWKKYIKFIIIIWALLTIIMYAFANRNLNKMYGGHTGIIDHIQFEVELKPFIINNINVLSEDGNKFIENSFVSVENGIITSVDTIFGNPNNFEILDGKNKYLIPGLTDAHVHLWQSPNDLLLYIANGVTQVRELIGHENHLLWKEEIEKGRIGPEMYISSPRLGTFGTIEGWWMEWSQCFRNITDDEDAKKSVQYFKDQGYDGIKIYSQLSEENYKALCEKADELDMQVMGHIPFSVTLDDVYNSSQDEVSHFEEIMNALNREFGYYSWDNTKAFFDFVDRRSLEVADKLIEHGIVVTSTLFGTENIVANTFDLENQLKKVELEYANPGIVEWSILAPGGLGWLPDVSRFKIPDGLTKDEIAGRRLHWETYEKAEKIVANNLIKKGVKIMTGTDAGLPIKVPGFSLHDEFLSLYNAGMFPNEIIRSSTQVPAEYMNSNTGIIERGRKANLLLLDENPLVDIKNIKSINTVILNGRILDRSTLDNILVEIKKTNDFSRTKEISKYLN